MFLKNSLQSAGLAGLIEYPHAGKAAEPGDAADRVYTIGNHKSVRRKWLSESHKKKRINSLLSVAVVLRAES